MPESSLQFQPAASAATAAAERVITTRGLGVAASGRTILRAVNLTVEAGQGFGLIGPNGAGKSTLLRCLNRLVDLSPGFRVSGGVSYHGQDIYAPRVDADDLRTRIGMLFQQPVVFPTTIARNVLFGVRHLGRVPRAQWPETAERALREAALWNEVKDRLDESALRLSVGQQQRLCLARALAVGPDVILMDEPTSALDPRSTEAIEELILRLKARCTVVIVTHNLAQARRVTDWLGCVCVRDGAGELAETACCDALLSRPRCREVAEYLGTQA